MYNEEEIYHSIILYYQHKLKDEDSKILQLWRSESSENEKEFQQILRTLEYAERIRIINQINTMEDLRFVKQRIANKPAMRLRRIGTKLLRYAAILTIPFFIGTLWGVKQFKQKTELVQSVVMKNVETAFGIRSQITLSDGTKVWLNSGSKLTYPDTFHGDVREVSLVGEAFFQVVSDKKNPFYVNVGAFRVKATGTAFNVVNYPNESSLEVILDHGKIDLVKALNGKEQQICSVNEGEMVKYLRSKNHISVSKVDVSKYTEWTNGRLVFRNDKMEDVITRIGRWYNAEIILQGEGLSDYYYTATFESETLGQIMDLLKYSAPIDYTIEQRSKMANDSFSKQKIIIRSKKKALNVRK